MREIKFRVWDNLIKLWLCEDSQYLQMDGKKVHSASWSTIKWDIPSDQYVIQQYTGLLDKNGKEIYEGDIIRGMMDFGPAGFHERSVVVIWDNEEGYQWNYFDLTSIKIEGNMFENPELLELI
jgi:uncharacterized phage protein (TIGR01671 family)